MGRIKDQQIKEQERGYGSSNKCICDKCVGNYYLKSFIQTRGNEMICDYCEEKGVSVCLEDLMELIIEGIRQEYEDANGCMGYDGGEGGFQGAETMDSYDLIFDELYDEFSFENDDIYQDVWSLINDSITWCQKDPYGELPYDEDFYTWQQFVQTLKENGKDAKFLENKQNLGTYNRVDKVLDRIGLGIKRLGLIEQMPERTCLWRARAHSKSEIINSAASLGSPKDEIAGCNRMNFKGESTFYGAFEKETALSEIINKDNLQRTIGMFHNVVPLTVINLHRINELSVPSIFDIEQNEERMLLIFLKRFNREISKPVDVEKEKEYIPTQKVMEYFKKTLVTDDLLKIDGIIYTSAQNEEERCCALFISAEQCSDNPDKMIQLDLSSIEHLN